MQEVMLPILFVTVAVLLVYGVWQIVRELTSTDANRIKSRLSADGVARVEDDEDETGSIVVDAKVHPLTARLLKLKFMQELYRKLMQAYPDMPFSRFLTIVASCAFGGTFLVWVIIDNLIVSAVAGAIAAYVPLVIVASKKNRRQRMMADQLPDALDFLSRILKAGHGMAAAMQMLGDELPEPLAGEFRRAYDQHSLGQPLEDCMRQLMLRIESTDFAYFATAVLIQRQTGGDLSEILENISGMIRQRIRLQNHVRAKTAEGRFSGYILVAFPALMFVVSYTLSPKQAGVLLYTETGIIMLMIAFGLQGLGLFAIRKITKVRV